jgi:peptide/nickel transport system substrate-binding protein
MSGDSIRGMTRRSFVKGLVGSGALLGVGACSSIDGGSDDGGSSGGKPQRGGTLSAAKTVDILGLDPHRDTLTYPGQWLMPLIYTPLYNVGPNLEPRPGAAERFDLEGGTTYVFHLRDGIRFHSGDPLEAEDVKYSLDRFLNPDAGYFAAGWLSDVDGVEVRDPLTVAVHLRQQNWALPASMYWMYVLPRSVADEPDEWTTNNENGSGPFRLNKWEPSQVLELDRFDEYYESSLPYLDGVSLPVVPDESTAVGSLLSGNLDLLTINDPNNVRLVENAEVETLRTTISGPYMINFNALQGLMTQDVMFRRALSLATDREEILSKVNAGLGKVCGIFSSTFDYAYVPPEELRYSRLDLDEAADVLRQSSYPTDRVLRLITITSDPVMRATGELVKTQWQKLGISVDLQSMESNAWTDMIVNPDNQAKWDITINSFSALPNAHLQATNMAKGLSAFYGPVPDAFVSSVDEAAKELDPARRSEMYKNIGRLVDDQVLQIYTYEPIQVDAFQSSVDGLIPYPDRTYRELEKAWLA